MYISLILITPDLVQKPLSSHMTVTGCGFEIHPCNINILGIVYPLSFPSLFNYMFLITVNLTLIQKAFVFSNDSGSLIYSSIHPLTHQNKTHSPT